jgi:hypothetical protein
MKGGAGPAHRKAAGCTRQLYSHWKIDRHRLIIRDGIESWDIIDWEDLDMVRGLRVWIPTMEHLA